MANLAYVNAQSNTGTCTATAPAVGSGVTWNLTSLSVSQAGGVSGTSAKLTIWDGPVGSGTVLFAVFLAGPGNQLLGSVGSIQDIQLPKSPQGVSGIQATPGNAMNIQVVGTGNNSVSINARFSDGLP
jgi:hypothetical protein